MGKNRTWTNLYKRTDIFRCVHETHRGFKNRMSVYHILKEKKCFPNGCYYFRWSCKELSKNRKCHRGYSHVGRKCPGCRFFVDEKIHNYPELQVSEPEYRQFLRELEEFEDWLTEIDNKELEILGTISSVKPLFVKKVYPKTSFLSFRSYLLVFREIYLGMDLMRDYVYALVSKKLQQQYRFAAGDRLEARARLTTDRGRLILHRLNRIQVEHHGSEENWDDQKVLLARETATIFPTQPEGCVQCPFGALVDLVYAERRSGGPRRELLCLQGIQDYRDCYVRAEYCGLEAEANAASSHSCRNDRHLLP